MIKKGKVRVCAKVLNEGKPLERRESERKVESLRVLGKSELNFLIGKVAERGKKEVLA